jgi:hypothetical protein
MLGGFIGVAFAGTDGAVTMPRAGSRPNIVLILADDMGYGDPGCYNPRSKTPTPHIDRLASQGVRFTDAHAPAALCVPSRYSLLTGRYPFRYSGSPDKKSLIEPGRPDARLAPATARVRHGDDRQVAPGDSTAGSISTTASRCAAARSTAGSTPSSGCMPRWTSRPYFLIEDDRCLAAPTETIAASRSPMVSPIQGAFWREGKIAPGLRHEEVLPLLTDRAVGSWIPPGAVRREAVLPLLRPHRPAHALAPLRPFRGRSGPGAYGDFVAQVDDSVGRVLDALDRLGVGGETLVIYTSDNGPVWYPVDVQRYDHSSTGGLRGAKADVWEGGHRVPFVARWPGRIEAGSSNGQTICFTDLLATFAAVVGDSLPDGAGEDSYNVLPLLLGEKVPGPVREATIFQSSSRLLAIRQGDWKLIPARGGGGFIETEPGPKGGPRGQLYHLGIDPFERSNVYDREPEVVQRLTLILKQYQEQKLTRPSIGSP